MRDSHIVIYPENRTTALMRYRSLLKGSLNDYVALTSPRIIMLVLLTSFAGLWAGSRGGADMSLIIPFLIGIGLASAGASVFNDIYDSDIDRLMKRTSLRPLIVGRIHPGAALFFGICLSITGYTILMFFVGAVPTALALFAIFVYVIIYTVILKRQTPLATEIGGIAGAMPPLIGWVAAADGLGLNALVLFVIMFLWQPPHFWSLASHYRKDYIRASVPSMPIVLSEEKMKMRSLIYIMLLILFSTIPYVTGLAGRVYLIFAILFGCLYVCLAMLGLILKKDVNRVIFAYSIIYMTVMMTVMIGDVQNVR